MKYAFVTTFFSDKFALKLPIKDAIEICALPKNATEQPPPPENVHPSSTRTAADVVVPPKPSKAKSSKARKSFI